MTAENFCYWLQGKLEIDGKPQPLTAEQVEVIQRHLSLVFVHDIDPKAGGPDVQKKLNEIHQTPFPPFTMPHCSVGVEGTKTIMRC